MVSFFHFQAEMGYSSSKLLSNEKSLCCIRPWHIVLRSCPRWSWGLTGKLAGLSRRRTSTAGGAWNGPLWAPMTSSLLIPTVFKIPEGSNVFYAMKSKGLYNFILKQQTFLSWLDVSQGTLPILHSWKKGYWKVWKARAKVVLVGSGWLTVAQVPMLQSALAAQGTLYSTLTQKFPHLASAPVTLQAHPVSEKRIYPLFPFFMF